MRALVTGATGFVGRHLMKRLRDPLVLSRNPEAARQLFPSAKVRRGGWAESIASALTGHPCDAVFHLAGEPIAEGRWNESKKQRIRNSRVAGTRALVDAISQAEVKPGALVSASAVGYYGSQGDRILGEDSAAGKGFLADVCCEWEAEAARAETLGVRVVSLRIGIVLGSGGGALAAMLTPFKLGLGGPLGSGRQWTPWIHVDDLVDLALFAAQSEQSRGALNAVAPGTIRNREFAAALGRALHRPAIMPAPAFALRLVLGEFANVLLASQRVVPSKLRAAGYAFRFADINAALAEALSKPTNAVETAPRPEAVR